MCGPAKNIHTLVCTGVLLLCCIEYRSYVMKTLAGVPTMARKPTKKPSQAWASGKPLAAQLRGSAEWKEWLDELAKTNRQSVAGVIDTALARLAREVGFREPPER